MALLFMDGFDYLTDGMETFKWDYGYGTGFMQVSSLTRRGIGQSLDLDGNVAYYLRKSFSVTPQTVILGFAFRIDNVGDETTNIAGLWRVGGSSSHIMIGIGNDGSIRISRHSVLLESSTTGLVVSGGWYHLEVKVTISNTVGAYEVRLNGSTVMSDTGVDTAWDSEEYVNRLEIYARDLGWQIDDLFLCDTTGSTCNDFLGDCVIDTLYPTSDGTNTDFTPASGVDHYAMVDVAKFNGSATDYVESSTVGHKETFGMTTHSTTKTIFGIGLNGVVTNPDVGSREVRLLCLSGTVPTENEGLSYSLPQGGAYAYLGATYEQEPTDSVAWTSAKINAAEFGLKVQA